MAEPARKRVLRPRGGGVGRGVRGGRGARGDRGPRAGRGGRGVRSRAQRSPYGCTMDSVLVDLVSDNDEDIVELAAARGAADPMEAQSPQPQVPATPPDDSDSDSDGADVRPSSAPETLVRQRRRRLQLDPGEAPVVPVYSGKVESSFHPIPVSLSLLKFHPDGAEEGAEEEAGVADSSSPPPGDLSFSSCPWKLRSKDDKEKKTGLGVPDTFPLSSPPRSKNKKHTRALRKLREVNRRLQDLRSCLSPKRHQGPDSWSQDDEVVLVEGPVLPENTRLFPLKVRCRADVVRLPIRMSDPLQSVVDHMASHLGVAPSRILLLFGETELSPTATPRTLKLGVADIIDCVVLASSPEDAGVSQQLRLRVQGKEKHQMLEISLSQDSPLKTLMSHYEEAMGLSGHKLSFFFDGTKLSGKELPADLGMESGDLIEVWA